MPAEKEIRMAQPELELFALKALIQPKTRNDGFVPRYSHLRLIRAP
ncbi:hypothetical protein [Sulfitobacter sp. JB4-11]